MCRKMVKNISEFIKNGIWQKKDYEYKSRNLRWAARQFKVFIMTTRGFGEHDLIIRSAALTFYTLMSLVPIAALIFGVVKGFGLDIHFVNYLYMEFPQYSTIIDSVYSFANNMLLKTKGGVIVAIGFVVLIWAVMRVFGNIEGAFNHIWEVHKSRGITRKLSDYIAVIFVAPILWVFSNSVSIYIKSQIESYTKSALIEVLYALASLLAIWIMFSFIYRIMPNTKVKLKSAIMAGIVAGTFFQIFQVAYLYIQSEVSAYNAIYGSFAALPLFLIWLQTSWQILLFGAELSFAYQNIKKYEQEREVQHMSYDIRRKVMVGVMLMIIKHFVRNEGAVTSEYVANELNLPVRIVRDVIFDMERADLLCAVRSNYDDKVNMYIPARDIHTITVMDVIQRVERHGKAQIEFSESAEMEQICTVIDKIMSDETISPTNVVLMDIIEK